MEIKILKQDFSICKLEDFSKTDVSQDFCFIGKTDQENSLVCPTAYVPENIIEKEDGWKAFRIQGILDFSLIGILAELSGLLAENKIGIFVISTYNTDYILVKAENLKKAESVLRNHGYHIIQ